MAEVEEIQDQFIALSPEEEYVNFSSSYVPSFYINVLRERQETVRVILGQLGQRVRMSAPKIDIVTEGSTPKEAWFKFLKEMRERLGPDESAWLSLDIAPVRPEEINQALDAPEDEDWSGLLIDAEK